MNLTLYLVPAGHIIDVWEDVRPLLISGLENRDAEYSIDELHEFLLSGQWKLCIAADSDDKIHGAAAISFITYPNEHIAFVSSIGGRLIIDENTVTQFKTILRKLGATRLQGAVSEALARFYRRFDFERKAILVEMSL